MKTVNSQLLDFATNSKFKTTKSNTYTFFNINESKQIRIYRNNKTAANSIKYQVTLHTISSDNITYNDYELNRPAFTLKEAKLIAAEYYFKFN